MFDKNVENEWPGKSFYEEDNNKYSYLDVSRPFATNHSWIYCSRTKFLNNQPFINIKRDSTEFVINNLMKELGISDIVIF